MKNESPEFKAKWLRDRQVIEIYSLSRSKVWALAKAEKIRSVSLQEPGMSRATRLFEAASIDKYIESFLPKTQTLDGQSR
jgi:predicted DNA-binding transcriptional regulator AlpA